MKCCCGRGPHQIINSETEDQATAPHMEGSEPLSNNPLYFGLPEIAGALRCSVRKLHDAAVKKELIIKKVIFKRKAGNYGKVVWCAYEQDLIRFQKERVEPF